MFSGWDIAVELGYLWVLFSFQHFKRWFRTLWNTSSSDWFTVDDTKESPRIFLSSLHILGGVSTITSMKLSVFLVYLTDFLPLSLNSMVRWVINKGHVFHIFSTLEYVASYWDSFPMGSFEIILSWWVYWIMSNISSWMKNYSWSDIEPSYSSGIPINFQPHF